MFADKKKKLLLSLVVVLPQLGEFDSSEFVEQLVAPLTQSALKENNIDLKVVGIGDAKCAQQFAKFTKLIFLSIFLIT